MLNRMTVRVPATSANIGPGFDTLGCALGLYNTVSFEKSGKGINVYCADKKYANEDNLTARAYMETLERIYVPKPVGLNVAIHTEIPIGKGLGSSAALIVAGVFAANEMHGSPLTRSEMLAIASKIEGHPDNAAPAIFGGMVVSAVRGDIAVTAKYKVHPGIRFTLLVPDFKVSTVDAREVLPEMIPRSDAVFTEGCLAILLKAFETGDKKGLAVGLQDKLHQPYRKVLIDGYDEIERLALQCGADGLVISGSGSSCLAVGGGEGFAENMRAALEILPHRWKVKPLLIDQDGAAIVKR